MLTCLSIEAAFETVLSSGERENENHCASNLKDIPPSEAASPCMSFRGYTGLNNLRQIWPVSKRKYGVRVLVSHFGVLNRVTI